MDLSTTASVPYIMVLQYWRDEYITKSTYACDIFWGKSKNQEAQI